MARNMAKWPSINEESVIWLSNVIGRGEMRLGVSRRLIFCRRIKFGNRLNHHQ